VESEEGGEGGVEEIKGITNMFGVDIWSDA
jgi:hypothetical protein